MKTPFVDGFSVSKNRFHINAGSVCGLSTVVACKLGQSTVCVFKTRLQVNSGFVCGL